MALFLLSSLFISAASASDACVCGCYSYDLSANEYGSAELDSCSDKCDDDYCAAEFPDFCADLTLNNDCVGISSTDLSGTYQVQPGVPCMEDEEGELGACVPPCTGKQTYLRTIYAYL